MLINTETQDYLSRSCLSRAEMIWISTGFADGPDWLARIENTLRQDTVVLHGNRRLSAVAFNLLT